MKYFKEVVLTPLLLALIALLSQTVHAEVEKVCDPSNKTELKQALLRWSPFEGSWTWRQDKSETGPMKMTVREMAGVPYLIWSSRNSKKEQIGPAEYSVRFVSENAFEFAFSSAHFELKLTKDCAIRGTEFHKKFGAVDINLPAEGSGVPVGGPVSGLDFETEEEFQQYLLDHSDFSGEWNWSTRSNEVSVSFSKDKEGALVSQFSRKSSSGKERVADSKIVQIADPALVKIALPGKHGKVHFELQPDGSLEGVQIYDEKYAFLIQLSPAQ